MVPKFCLPEPGPRIRRTAETMDLSSLPSLQPGGDHTFGFDLAPQNDFLSELIKKRHNPVDYSFFEPAGSSGGLIFGSDGDAAAERGGS